MDFDQGSSKHMISFCGKIIETTLVTEEDDDPSLADQWVQDILLFNIHNHKIIVGFDCKYATSHPIRSMNHVITTLQLCVDATCLVLKLSSHGSKSIPESLKSFFTNPKVCLFGLEVKDNVSKLQRGYGVVLNCTCVKVFDIRELVSLMFPLISHCRRCRRGKLSLRAIAYKVAGLSVRERNIKCGDDQELVEGACVDAYACFMIAQNLLS